MFESHVRINTSSTDASSYNILQNEASGNAIKLIDKNQQLDITERQPLPHIVQEEDTYNLRDLLSSNFPMKDTDKAFSLSHEELIKATSILLYKFNLSAKKNQYQRTELTKLFNERINKTEQLFKSQFQEINEFLHMNQQQFEDFIQNHKKEHVALNTRVVNATDNFNKMSTKFSTSIA